MGSTPFLRQGARIARVGPGDVRRHLNQVLRRDGSYVLGLSFFYGKVGDVLTGSPL